MSSSGTVYATVMQIYAIPSFSQRFLTKVFRVNMKLIKTNEQTNKKERKHTHGEEAIWSVHDGICTGERQEKL